MMRNIISLCLLLTLVLGAPENKQVSLTRLAMSPYHISSDAVSFVQAWAYCENYGMRLLSFASSQENADLMDTLNDLGVARPNYFWIGGMYLQAGPVAKWYWVDGSTFVYSNWNTASISTVDNCIRWDYTTLSTTNGRWTPVNCALKYKFICKA